MDSFNKTVIALGLLLLFSFRAPSQSQIFYYDFIPSDSDLVVLSHIDNKIRKSYKDYSFSRELVTLSNGERDDIFKHIKKDIKTSKPDSSNSYRVHFFADKKLEKFQIIACSKNYKAYTTVYLNGEKDITQIKSRPAYELNLINFNKILDSNDFKNYQSIIYESFVNNLSKDVEAIDLHKNFGYNSIEIDTAFKN